MTKFRHQTHIFERPVPYEVKTDVVPFEVFASKFAPPQNVDEIPKRKISRGSSNSVANFDALNNVPSVVRKPENPVTQSVSKIKVFNDPNKPIVFERPQFKKRSSELTDLVDDKEVVKRSRDKPSVGCDIEDFVYGKPEKNRNYDPELENPSSLSKLASLKASKSTVRRNAPKKKKKKKQKTNRPKKIKRAMLLKDPRNGEELTLDEAVKRRLITQDQANQLTKHLEDTSKQDDLARNSSHSSYSSVESEETSWSEDNGAYITTSAIGQKRESKRRQSEVAENSLE